eukprot:766705-Hanusia_phi.AAC.2
MGSRMPVGRMISSVTSSLLESSLLLCALWHVKVKQGAGRAKQSHLLQLPLAGGGRNEDALVYSRPELFLLQRPVVECRREAKAMADQRLLPHPVAEVHAAHLRDSDVRLVDDEEPVLANAVRAWTASKHPTSWGK